MEDISMRGAVVRISQDGMEAYLTLQPPEAGEGYTLSELVRYIRTQRVTNGIDEAAIQEMIDGGVYMRDVCIAKGEPPVNAEHGRNALPRKRISLYRRRKYLYCRPVWKD